MKEEALEKARFFVNYNTVEAVLLGCAVLVNLFGIMFESEYLEAAELESLTGGSEQLEALEKAKT